MVIRPLASSLPFQARLASDASLGFTVIELMIVVAILVILLAIAGPDFRSMIAATRVKNASFDVFSSLTLARSEAITRNATVTIAPTGGDWANGWTITEAGGTVVRIQDAYPNVTISGPTRICFNGMGRLTTPNALAQVCTVVGVSLSLTASGVIDRNNRCVMIDPSGRPVTKEGACS